MSAADVIAVLAARHLRYDWENPHAATNDHLVFSKGHASPLLYSLFKAVGVVSDDELMTGYRRFGQRLEGHPTPVLPWVDVATGSLGQGLPDGVGLALSGRYLEHLPFPVWVLCGDSELAEGSIWEALDKASYYKLSNLVVMADINRLGQRSPTDLGWDLDVYQQRFAAFGARTLVIDGHDLAAIEGALAQAAEMSGDRPTAILAKTIKGRGFPEVENKEGWHGKPFPPDMAARANRCRTRFTCTRCGHEEHADVNAAQIITARGQVAETSWRAAGCPVAKRPVPRNRRRQAAEPSSSTGPGRLLTHKSRERAI